MKRKVIRVVVITNLFAIALLLVLSFQQYRTEAKMSKLLGDTESPLLRHGSSFVGPAMLTTVLLCGIILELRSTKVAIFINLGVPICLLVSVLADSVLSWRQNPQEVQEALILVALPLFVVSSLYAILYRRNVTQSHHRTAV